MVVFIGLFLRNLSMMALDTWCLLINEYVDSVEFFNVFQNGLYSIISQAPFRVSINDKI